MSDPPPKPPEDDPPVSLDPFVKRAMRDLSLTDTQALRLREISADLKREVDTKALNKASMDWDYKLSSLKNQVTKALKASAKARGTRDPSGAFPLSSVAGLDTGVKNLERLRSELYQASVDRANDLRDMGMPWERINATHVEGTKTIDSTKIEVWRYLDDLDKEVNDCLKVIGQSETRGKIKPKSEEALKPKKLSFKASPIAVDDFLTDLKAWFSASNYNLLPRATQKSSVINLMEGNLANIINVNFDASAPIFEAEEVGEAKNSMERLIKKQFLTIHPMVQRKMDVFKFRQEGYGEKFIQTTSRFIEQWRIAEWDKGSVKDLQKYLFVSVILNEKLKEKLIEAMNKDPATTLEALITIGETWELNHSTLVACTPAANKRAKPSAYKLAKSGAQPQVKRPAVKQFRPGRQLGRGGRGGRGGHRSQSRGRSSSRNPNDKCSKCGNKGHSSSQCFLDVSKSCSKCKKKGHYARDCRQKAPRFTTSRAQYRPNRGGGRGQARNSYVAVHDHWQDSSNHSQFDIGYWESSNHSQFDIGIWEENNPPDWKQWPTDDWDPEEDQASQSEDSQSDTDSDPDPDAPTMPNTPENTPPPTPPPSPPPNPPVVKVARVKVAEVASKPKLRKVMPRVCKAKSNFDGFDLANIPVVDKVLPTPMIPVLVTPQFGKPFKLPALPDTGAQVTLIEEKLAKSYNLPIYKNSWMTIRGVNKESIIKIYATCPIIVSYGENQVYITNPHVNPYMDEGEVMLDWQVLEYLKACRINPDPDSPAQVKFVTELGQSGKPKSLEKLVENYPEVFSDTLDKTRMLKGPPMVIHFKEGPVRPCFVTSTKAIPVNLKKAADDTIEKLESQGILKSLKPGEDSPWCSRGFWVPKKDGKSVRLVTDFIQLNNFVRRPIHPFQPSMNCLMSIAPGMRVFITADATNGYFQIPLEKKSSYYTTFLLPQGRFRYLRAPMGLSASSDEWCARSDAIMRGAENAIKLVDDILVYGATEQEALNFFKKIVEACKQLGMTLSKKKLEMGSRARFGGMIVSHEGVSPDPDSTKAIREYPTPENATDIRSFLGLAQFLGRFVPDLTALSLRMRELTKAKVAFTWLPAHQEDFNQIKKVLTGPLVVRHYDPSLSTEVITDASRLHGLGFLILQFDPKDPEQRRWLIMAGSRALIPAEKNYATIDLEMLGIVYACEKGAFFLLGCPHFHVKTDHKPLVGLFNKEMAEVKSLRQLKFRERLAMYRFDVSYIEGIRNLASDALSRHPVNFLDPNDHPHLDEENAVICSVRKLHLDTHNAMVQVNAIMAEMDASDPAFEFIREAIDDDYKALAKAILDDHTHPDNARSVKATNPLRTIPRNLWPHLEVINDLVILYSTRVVVPKKAIPRVLQLLHLSHPGVVKMKETARHRYWWQNMTKSINDICGACEMCQRNKDSKPVANQGELKLAQGPLDRVHADFCTLNNHDYLILVDAYSGFPWCIRVNSMTARALCKVLFTTFKDLGMPKVIRSDGGPCFIAQEYKDFCKKFHITPVIGSPYHHEGCGQAESMVKVMKKMLKKCDSYDDFEEALMEYRVTNNADGINPSELFHGRIMRTQLPGHPKIFDIIPTETRREKAKLKANKKKVYDSSKFDAKLAEFSIGTKVYVQEGLSGDPKKRHWEPAVITELHPSRRSFTVKRLKDGSTAQRNIRFIRVAPIGKQHEKCKDDDFLDFSPIDKLKSVNGDINIQAQKTRSRKKQQPGELRRSARLKDHRDKEGSAVAKNACARTIITDNVNTEIFTQISDGPEINRSAQSFQAANNFGLDIEPFSRSTAFTAITANRRQLRSGGNGGTSLQQLRLNSVSSEPINFHHWTFSCRNHHSRTNQFRFSLLSALLALISLTSIAFSAIKSQHFSQPTPLSHGPARQQHPLAYPGFAHIGPCLRPIMGKSIPPPNFEGTWLNHLGKIKPRRPEPVHTNFIHIKASGTNVTEDIEILEQDMGITGSLPKTTTKSSSIVDQSIHNGYRLFDFELSDATGLLGISVCLLAVTLLCLCLHRCCHMSVPIMKASWKKRKMKQLAKSNKELMDQSKLVELNSEDIMSKLDSIISKASFRGANDWNNMVVKTPPTKLSTAFAGLTSLKTVNETREDPDPPPKPLF